MIDTIKKLREIQARIAERLKSIGDNLEAIDGELRTYQQAIRQQEPIGDETIEFLVDALPELYELWDGMEYFFRYGHHKADGVFYRRDIKYENTVVSLIEAESLISATENSMSCSRIDGGSRAAVLSQIKNMRRTLERVEEMMSKEFK